VKFSDTGRTTSIQMAAGLSLVLKIVSGPHNTVFDDTARLHEDTPAQKHFVSTSTWRSVGNPVPSGEVVAADPAACGSIRSGTTTTTSHPVMGIS